MLPLHAELQLKIVSFKKQEKAESLSTLPFVVQNNTSQITS